MTEEQFNTIASKLDTLIKLAEVSGVFYSQASNQLRDIINLLMENRYE